MSKIFGLVLIASVAITSSHIPVYSAPSKEIELVCQSSTQHYTFMWWQSSVREKHPRRFAVKTNLYSFLFDYEHLNLQSLITQKEKRSSVDILKVPEKELFADAPNSGISFGTIVNGKERECTASSGNTEDCQLVQSGRFLQHRFINNIPDLGDCDKEKSGMDVMAWSDRLSFILKVVPLSNFSSEGIFMRFTVPSDYYEIAGRNGFKIFRHRSNGSGYLLSASVPNMAISVSGNVVEVIQPREQLVDGDLKVGIVIYPAENLITEISRIIDQETNPVTVVARQIAPVDHMLSVRFMPEIGWHYVGLRNDVTGNQEEDNKRMERVIFTLDNQSPFEKNVRLNFGKKGEVFGITGISGILRDGDGYPTGIPVQLSKNWHTKDFRNYDGHRYRGPWFHGLSVLTIPPYSTITLEYTSVNAFWGTVPAVSHAQLSLVGWGNNQLWDQSAIGAWGETLCYEPDLAQASAPVLDARPLLVVSPEGKKWGWTGNVGGADFFSLRKKDGKRAWHTGVRTHYKRNCPNLTEVSYSGEMLNGDVHFQYTTSIGRSDDIARGIYRIRMDVTRDISFDALQVFQMGAATYHYSVSNSLAIGNENGLIKEREVTGVKKESTLVGEMLPLEGSVPWICLYNSQLSEEQKRKFTGADRGLVIRSWESRIAGNAGVGPYWQEYFSRDGNHGPAGSVINISVPPTCNSLKAGDYIEAEIVMFLLPQDAKHYYGPDENMAAALRKNAGSWRLAYREAAGNAISVHVEKGMLERHYPIVLSAQDNTVAFSVKGGIGYVPLTIKGLSSYKSPVIYTKEGGQWKMLEQARNGNDFWQTDFDEKSGTWEISYNLPLKGMLQNSENEFRFELITSK